MSDNFSPTGGFHPLEEWPNARRWVYAAQWFINLILGATAVVLTAMGLSPLWYVIVTGVFNFVWSYSGVQAQTNTPKPVSARRRKAPREFTE